MVVDGEGIQLYWWMRPLMLVGRIRTAVRATVAADALRLRELPSIVGGVVLPLLAILIPAAITAYQATTQTSVQGDPYDVFTFYINDVFTESMPFMIAAALIGMLSPAAGALLVLVYAVGNVAATIITNELEPVGPALFGRLVSFLLFWILAVEIPLAARYMVEWWSYKPTPYRSKRVIAVVAGGLVAALLAQAWAMAAPLLITPVFLLTGPWGNPFLRAVTSIATYPYYLSIAVGVAGTVLLGVRYLGPRILTGRSLLAGATTSPPGRVASLVVGLVLALVLMSGLIEQPLDAAILVGVLVLAPIIARAALRMTGLARPLRAIAWPVRLVMGFGVSILVAWVVVGVVSAVSLVDSQPITRWFPVVIGVAVSYLVMQLFMAADDVVAAGPRAASGATATIATVVIQLLVFVAFLAVPAVALADDWDGYLDIPASLLKDAAAGIGGLAAMIGGLFGSAPPPREGPPKLKEYTGPPGQDQGPKPRSQRPGPKEYAGPEAQDVPAGPPPLPPYTPPSAPPPEPPHWSDRFMPDGWTDFRGPSANR